MNRVLSLILMACVTATVLAGCAEKGASIPTQKEPAKELPKKATSSGMQFKA
jgi:hypothetical protein